MQFLFMFLLSAMAVFLILIVLVQRGRGGGLSGAFGGAGGQSAFGAKAGDVFTKITMWTAFLWIVLCILAVLTFKNTSDERLGGLGGAANGDDAAGTVAPEGVTPPADGDGATPQAGPSTAPQVEPGELPQTPPGTLSPTGEVGEVPASEPPGGGE